jgi:hypothetical protein
LDYKDKGNGVPIRTMKVYKGSRGMFHSLFISALEICGELHALAVLYHLKETRYPLSTRMRELQSWPDCSGGNYFVPSEIQTANW